MNKDSDNYSIAGRYRTVRKHLDALGYKQALSLDSLPLIELLLVDLAQTKESLKHFQSIAKDNLEACSQLQLAVDPYKCDNAKLVQECNKTHLELIELKETHQRQINDYKKKIRKLESELSDLQLSFSKNLQRIKLLETESANKSKKILELQGKCCKPIVNNVNLATKKRACYPLRRPTLEAESLPRISTSTTSFSSKSVEPYIVDFVSTADHRISSLNNEVAQLKEELFLNNEYIETLKSMLNTKDKEMSRLRKMLEGGRPCTSINKDHCCLVSDKINGYPRQTENDDLLILQQAKLNLEQQLKESLNKQHDAMSQAMKLAERNEELEKELKDVDRIALAVEADCNSTVKENNRRVCRLQEKLEDVMTQVHVLENELTVQRREAQELRADLEACRLEKSNVQRILESTLEEKKQMTDRINNLTIMASKSPDKHVSHQQKRSEFTASSNFREYSCGKKTHDEASLNTMDKLLREKNVIVESLQNTIDKIERERDHYKSECMKFKGQSKKDTEKDNNGTWSQVCELRAQMSEKEHAISKLLREKKELCQEKFNLESKLHDYQMHQNRSNSPCNFCRCRTSPLNERIITSTSNKIERLEKERDAARADVERLIEERDALRERLKETRRAAIHGLDDQLDDLKEDLRRTKQELTEQRTQYFQLRALQDQTDEALGDVQGQLTQSENELSNALDRNKNLERQQLQLDNQIKELRQEISTHRSRMAQMDREKDQLLMDLDEKTEKIAALEREIEFKEQQANNTEQQIRELSHTKQICIDQAADLERQMRSMQLDMDNLQRQLSSATLDRENAIQENRRLQDDLAAVSCEVRSILKDLEASKAESQDLKRQLQTYVTEVRRAEELLSDKENERTEMLNHFRSLSLEATVLENNNHSLETEAAEARGALQSARDQILDLQRQLSDKDCLVRGYEAQITELTQNVASLEIQLQQATEQRLCAEEDLRTVRSLCMTLEQQKECISQRLNENTDLKTQYEVQLSRYRSEQDIFQDQMNKDHVQIDRLEKLLEEARKETINGQSNCRELQNEVCKLKKKVSELQNKLSIETAEVRKYQTQAAEYNKQVTELRRQVTNERFERARMQEDSQRCNKALVPRNQRKQASPSSNEVDVRNLRCRICACSNKSSGNKLINTDRSKLHITEVSSSSNGTPNSCRSTNYENNGSEEKQYPLVPSNQLTRKKILSRDSEIDGIGNFINVNRVCFCPGEVETGDLMNKASINKDINCKKVDMRNNFLNNSNDKKLCSNSVSSSDDTEHCKRCGGRKRQKQCVQGTSPSFITNALNLIYKFLEGNKKLIHKKCAENQNSCREVTVNIVQQDEARPVPGEEKIELRKEVLRTKQQIVYSLMEACNSNSTVSTQTLESIIAISDNSMPHLLKILSEIQHYAKNIENLFCTVNETLNHQQSNINQESNNQENANQEHSNQEEMRDRRHGIVSTTLPVPPNLSSSKIDQTLPDDRFVEPAEPNSIADMSLPTETITRQSLFDNIDSNITNSDNDSDISKLRPARSASTPAARKIIDQPIRLENDQELSEMNSTENSSTSKEQRPSFLRSQNTDEDTTEYLALPDLARPRTSGDENSSQQFQQQLSTVNSQKSSSPRTSKNENSSQQFQRLSSLSKEQRQSLSRNQHIDLDTTEYLALPKLDRPRTSEDEKSSQQSPRLASLSKEQKQSLATSNEDKNSMQQLRGQQLTINNPQSTAQVSSFAAADPEYVEENDVDAALESIGEKIESLRRDVLTDDNESIAESIVTLLPQDKN